MTRKQWIVTGVIVALIALPVVLKLTRGDTNKAVEIEVATEHALSADGTSVGNLDLRKPGDAGARRSRGA